MITNFTQSSSVHKNIYGVKMIYIMYKDKCDFLLYRFAVVITLSQLFSTRWLFHWDWDDRTCMILSVTVEESWTMWINPDGILRQQNTVNRKLYSYCDVQYIILLCKQVVFVLVYIHIFMCSFITYMIHFSEYWLDSNGEFWYLIQWIIAQFSLWYQSQKYESYTLGHSVHINR